MIKTADDPEIIVIGGGPAGTTVATLTAQAGRRVLLLERERFPRFHVGESLIPETYGVIGRLGLLPAMKKSLFMKKFSVQFFTDSGRSSEPFYFSDYNPHESSQTWQVRRSEFDELLLNNARAHGVDAREGARVLDVIFEGTRAVGVKALFEGETEPRELHAPVIVDASGQQSLILGKLGLREWDPVLKKAALWTYFKGAQRDAGRDEGATLILQLQEKKGWFWYIPLHDDIVSVGVVASHEYLFRNRASIDFETVFNEEVARCPGLQPRIKNADRCDIYRAQKEYSYRSRHAAGEGWVLVGDAFGFLDPLYSSGILLAFASGEMAADAIIDGLARNDLSPAQLGRWEPEYVAGMERVRRLVCEFYDGFSFGRFVKRHPDLKGLITDVLIGDIFKSEIDQLWPLMEEMRAEDQSEAASGKTI